MNGDDFNEDMEQDSQESYCDAEDTIKKTDVNAPLNELLGKH